jgi:hypothetical protein
LISLKVHCQKFIAVVLAVVLSIPVFMVPASAAGGTYTPIAGFLADVLLPSGETSLGPLTEACERWNMLSASSTWSVFQIPRAEIYLDTSLNRYRLRTMDGTERWVVRSDGTYPYTRGSGDIPSSPGNAPADTPGPPSKTGNKFVDARAVDFNKAIVISYSALSAAVLLINGDGLSSTVGSNGPSANPYYIRTVGQGSSYGIYCNSAGLPYISSGPTAPSVVDNDFNLIVDNSKNNSDNVVIDDMKVIDTLNNQMTLINEFGDKITYNIDSLYWDASTHSYTANTYNVTNNTYNYYTWNITYNITNTYINYIGSNAAYQQEEYKYYYELPDGRSSEDLTADEVGAMSFQFADVKNYARSATDTSLRALYHFDGNTEDSGYFSTQTVFNWTSGASITYMDSSSFNGALYLDETAHKFDITLPSNIGSGDFSLQFRHYQASQPDTLNNIENTLSIGGNVVLRWDERNFYWGASGSTVAAVVPIGSWAEIALVRNNGILYLYINGLKVTSSANTTGYSGSIAFNFGSTSRAYTMLDELRFVNFAIAKAGANYQCATVPFDTNLVLVLPDSVFPIADEYWEVTYPSNSFSVSNVDLTQGAQTAFPTTRVSSYDGYSTFMAGTSEMAINFYNFNYNWGSAYSTYYINLLLSDGSILSAPFEANYDSVKSTMRIISDGGSSATVGSRTAGSYSWGYVIARVEASSNLYVRIQPLTGKTIDIAAISVTSSIPTSSAFKAEKISCIYSSEDIQPNTAAVQSSIPVTGYTVGGVRPTFPERGNVWFPVEGRRITGCYIYDGSMWRVAGCRYYTGTRWIPIYAFDIYTLADCWDVADAVDVTPPITSESGFWNWWKTEWASFRAWLKEAFAGLTGGSGGGDTIVIPPDSTHFPNIPGEDGEENEEGFSIFDIVKSIVDALWSLVTGVFKTIFGGVVSFFFKLTGSINDFFDAFKGNDGVFGFAKYGGADIWD